MAKPKLIYPELYIICKTPNNANFLSMLINWTGLQKCNEGWVYKTIEEAKKETGLGRTAQDASIRYLLKHKLIVKRTMGTHNKRHFMVNIQKIVDECPDIANVVKKKLEIIDQNKMKGFTHMEENSQEINKVPCISQTKYSVEAKQSTLFNLNKPLYKEAIKTTIKTTNNTTLSESVPTESPVVFEDSESTEELFSERELKASKKKERPNGLPKIKNDLSEEQKEILGCKVNQTGFDSDSWEFKCAYGLLKGILRNNPHCTNFEFVGWPKQITRLKNKGYDLQEIYYLLLWTQQDDFWKGQITSMSQVINRIDSLYPKFMGSVEGIYMKNMAEFYANQAAIKFAEVYLCKYGRCRTEDAVVEKHPQHIVKFIEIANKMKSFCRAVNETLPSLAESMFDHLNEEFMNKGKSVSLGLINSKGFWESMVQYYMELTKVPNMSPFFEANFKTIERVVL